MSKIIALKTAVDVVMKRINDPDQWESLVMEDREPHTFQAYTDYAGSRISLHRFEQCLESNAYWHPHRWPCHILVLQGSYHIMIGRVSVYELIENEMKRATKKELDLHLTAGSSYSMIDPQTWHAVHPKTICYSLMVNGESWHDHELQSIVEETEVCKSMDDLDLRVHLTNFRTLLQTHIKHAT